MSRRATTLARRLTIPRWCVTVNHSGLNLRVGNEIQIAIHVCPPASLLDGLRLGGVHCPALSDNDVGFVVAARIVTGL
jgi:hypothetical protein